MPAVEREYSYYEYGKKNQGVAKKAMPVSRSNEKARVCVTKAPDYCIKTTTTRDITRKATRYATRNEDFISNAKKINTKKENSKKKNNNDKKQQINKPKELTLKKPKTIINDKNQSERVLGIIKSVVVGILLLTMMFFICYRYSIINESFKALNAKKSELKDLQTVNAQIESLIKKNTDLSYIENYAKYQLGMQKPVESQIKKVVVKKEDKISKPLEIEEEKESSFINKVLDYVVDIF